MASQLIIPRQLDANGDPVSGAKANVYETGTSTPVTVYTDTGLSVPHANPIVSDGEGYFAQAFYGGSVALRVVVTDAADATLVTYDPVPLVSLSNSAASDVSHTPSTENPATDVQAAIDNLSDGTANYSAIQIDGAVKTGVAGADPLLLTGTAGADGNLAQWNADGDAVDAGVAASSLLAETSGSYTPTITVTSGSMPVNPGNDTLYWRRIGNVVTVQGILGVDSLSAPTGTVDVSLPTASAYSGGFGCAYFDTSAGTYSGLTCYLLGSNIRVGEDELNASGYGDGDFWQFAFSYIAT